MPDSNRRHKQVANAVRDELVKIVREDISDPRLDRVGAGLITFSGVDLTPDMRNATIWVSFMGRDSKDPDVKAALAALQSSANFMHRLLIKRIPMKMHPRLHFKFDKMFDRAAVVNEALAGAAGLEKETSTYRQEHGAGEEPKYRKKKSAQEQEEEGE